MEASKKYMEENGYNDRISFADGAIHTFKVLKDKEDSIPDAISPGGRKHGMKYLVEEDGVQKEIFTGSIGLISKLAKVECERIVKEKMFKENNKSYYKVLVDGAEIVDEGDEPVISDDEAAPSEPGW